MKPQEEEQIGAAFDDSWVKVLPEGFSLPSTNHEEFLIRWKDEDWASLQAAGCGLHGVLDYDYGLMDGEKGLREEFYRSLAVSNQGHSVH